MTAESGQNTVEPGTIVAGRYQIERQLGRGGFAHVHAALHIDLKRPVALKIIDLPSQAGAVDAFIARFLREAQIAANLSHPNVVTVYDYGVFEATGQPFLAMERLEGIDLEEYLRHHGSLGVERSVQLMLPVLDALDVAQSRGVVHKDLKPSNLFFVDIGTSRERLVVLDFGIARVYTDDESRLTKTGGYTGTPAYFAPEYADRQIVTPAIDVYQAGLILVEMITGQRAVQARSSVEYMIKHCQGQLDVPDELRQGEFGAVIDRALKTDYQARFADCGQFRSALEQLRIADVELGPMVATLTGEPPVTPAIPHFTDELHEDFGSGETLPHTPTEPFGDSGSSQGAGASTTGLVPPSRRVLPLAIVGALIVVGALAATIALRPTPPASPAPVTAPRPTSSEPVVPAAKRDRPAILRTDPVGAEVRIGGRSFGATPVEIYPHEVDGDVVDVEFTKSGYKTLVRRVKIAGSPPLDIRLIPEPTPLAEPRTAPPPDEPTRKDSTGAAKKPNRPRPSTGNAVERKGGTEKPDSPTPYSIVN